MVEIELTGVAERVTEIYDDLLWRAAHLARLHVLPMTSGLVRRFAPRETCVACALAADGGDHLDWVERARLVNTATRFGRLTVGLLEQLRGCPECLAGDGLVCRPHLLSGARPPDDLAPALDALSRRIGGVHHGLGLSHTAPTSVEIAPLVETLGWFAGWVFLRESAATARGS